jgi:hypothetical protein
MRRIRFSSFIIACLITRIAPRTLQRVRMRQLCHTCVMLEAMRRGGVEVAYLS